MNFIEKLEREFGVPDELALWDRIAGAARAVPTERLRETRRRHLEALGLSEEEGSGALRDRAAVTTFRRLAREALRLRSLTFSDDRIAAEIELSVENREIFLAASAADHEGALVHLVKLAEGALGPERGEDVVTDLWRTRRLLDFDGSGSLTGLLRRCSRRVQGGGRSTARLSNS